MCVRVGATTQGHPFLGALEPAELFPWESAVGARQGRKPDARLRPRKLLLKTERAGPWVDLAGARAGLLLHPVLSGLWQPLSP